MNDNIEILKEIIEKSNNIVFFGGAGVSTASGIKDFRGKDGLYQEKYPKSPEYYLSSDCLYNDTEEFYNFYKNKMNCLDALPNVIHKYLTKLEKKGKLKAIITQNIDGLHQKAGSQKVLEIHGSIHNNYCIKCGKNYKPEYIFNSEKVPVCSCGGLIRPKVVLYGEALPDCFYDAINYIQNADTLIVAGTSLTVQPASSLVSYFKGNNLILINNTKTSYDNLATLVINDDLAKIFSILDNL